MRRGARRDARESFWVTIQRKRGSGEGVGVEILGDNGVDWGQERGKSSKMKGDPSHKVELTERVESLQQTEPQSNRIQAFLSTYIPPCRPEDAPMLLVGTSRVMGTGINHTHKSLASYQS